MSGKKRKQQQTTAGQIRKHVVTKAGLQQKKEQKKKRHIRLPSVPPWILSFVLLWFFCAFVYGDVFYIAEQNSYIAFDKTVMRNVLDMNTGAFILTGRFLLLSFYYPLLGGFVMSLILTVSAWLLAYVLPLTGYRRLLALCLPFLYLAWLVYRGLNLYYHAEPGDIFSYPVLVLLVLAIIAVAVRLLAHRPMDLFWKKEKTAGVNAANISLEILLFAGLVVFAMFFRENTRATTRMQCQMEESDWDGMIETALKVEKPARSVCCYYCIALTQTGQIGTRLFDIRFQYPNMHAKTRDGEPDPTTEYYSADGDFYAGLINTSYHECMERCVIDGISVMRLKRMFYCALMNKECQLAYKYLNLISKMPFEGEFVAKNSALACSPSLVRKDRNLSLVADVMPVDDSFEQWYRTPLFIGYNVMLSSGRSVRALYNSLAACLYDKDLDAFYMRTLPLRGSVLPKNFEEAMVLYGFKHADRVKEFQISPFSLQGAKTFLTDALEYKGQDRKDVYFKLCSQYLGFYPFYYYFENIPDENYFLSNREKGRVN